MVRTIAAVGLVLLLAGCVGTPHITAAAPDSVTVQQDIVLHDRTKVEPQANYACAQYGKVARFRFETEGQGVRNYMFDCIAKP